MPQGGPTVPWTTSYDDENVPLDVVLTTPLSDGAEQPTDTLELTGAGSATVGWFGAPLHSRRFPSDVAANRFPVTVTLCMLTRPLLGLTVSVAADFFGMDVEVVDTELVVELLEQALSPSAAMTMAAAAAPVLAARPMFAFLSMETFRVYYASAS